MGNKEYPGNNKAADDSHRTQSKTVSSSPQHCIINRKRWQGSRQSTSSRIWRYLESSYQSHDTEFRGSCAFQVRSQLTEHSVPSFENSNEPFSVSQMLPGVCDSLSSLCPSSLEQMASAGHLLLGRAFAYGGQQVEHLFHALLICLVPPLLLCLCLLCGTCPLGTILR